MFLFFFTSLQLFSQESSYNNYTGAWADNASWVSGTSPVTVDLNTQVNIYGHITRTGSINTLVSASGPLNVYDTLEINGDLNISTYGNLNIGPGGILIVHGDFTAGYYSNIINLGYIVVTGEWKIEDFGGVGFGGFMNFGNVYIYDAAPENPASGGNYTDITCGTCYGNEADALASPIADLLSSTPLVFDITPSTAQTICQGDSVLFSTTDTADSYQWYLDDILIAGESGHSIYAKEDGAYHVSVTVDAETSATAKADLIVRALPLVQIGSYDTIWDINDAAFDIAGSPLGGVFVGKGISGLTYDPAIAGVGMDTVVYTYTDVNFCENSDTIIFNIRDYNYFEGARLIESIDNWCSSNAYYTTDGADADHAMASCLSYGPNVNRWFMFQATTDQVFIQVKITGAEGTARRPLLALWDTLGVALACQTYWDVYSDISVGYVGLTPGEWYFISVDNRYTGERGSFTLCVDDSVDYDFKEGAKVVPHTNDWKSADGEYTTRNASADGSRPPCWSYGPTSNRWFKFTALKSTVTVDLLIGGTEGSMRYPALAILNENDEIVACERFLSVYEDIRVGSDSLIIGNDYYIMVDHQYGTGYRGTFTLAIDDEVDYDYKGGAEIISHAGDYRSGDAEFTTVGATADVAQGSCWQNGTNFSRWFMFQATTDQLTAEVLTGGDDGTLRRTYLMLQDSIGNELTCTRYYSDYSDVKLAYEGLVPGEWYYLVVDNYDNAAYSGSFTLLIDNKVDYDFKAGAYEIPNINQWCSLDAEFSTMNATADEDAGSTWPTGPSFNRWFRFQATTNEALVEVKLGGEYGTLRRALVALWDDSGNELSSGRYTNDYSDVTIANTLLTPGEWYYISVDNYYTDNLGYRGTFTLCVDDEVDYDYPEGAVVLDDLNHWCSPNALYSTLFASGDGPAGSCWPNGPNYNRWFMFQATTNEVLFKVNTGGEDGTLR